MKKRLLIIPLAGLALVGSAVGYKIAHRETHQHELLRLKKEINAESESANVDASLLDLAAFNTPAFRVNLGKKIRDVDAKNRLYSKECADWDANPYTGLIRK